MVSTVGGTGSFGAAAPAALVLRTPQGRMAAATGAVILAGSVYIVSQSRTAGFFRRPDYMSGPEYVPPVSAPEELSVPGLTYELSVPGLTYVTRIRR